MKLTAIITAVLMVASPALADVPTVHNEDALRAACPNSAYDETSRACQVRTLLADLKAERLTTAQLRREVEAGAEAHCRHEKTYIALNEERLKVAILEGDADTALIITNTLRNLDTRSCK